MQKLTDNQSAYSVMFDQLDWYKDIITMLENYLDKQVVTSRDNRHFVERNHGEFDYHAGLYNGMQQAYADVRVVLRDLLTGELVDLELM